MIADGGQLQDVLVAPWLGLALEDGPVIGISSGVRHIAGEKQSLGAFLGDSLREPFTDLRIGAERFTGVGESHIAVSDHADRPVSPELAENQGRTAFGDEVAGDAGWSCNRKESKYCPGNPGKHATEPEEAQAGAIHSVRLPSGQVEPPTRQIDNAVSSALQSPMERHVGADEGAAAFAKAWNDGTREIDGPVAAPSATARPPPVHRAPTAFRPHAQTRQPGSRWHGQESPAHGPPEG